jgi:DNA polymerase III subunit delta'
MLIGHDKIRSQFSELMTQASFPQTSLWYGVNGVGKRQVALGLIANLFCESNEACKKCQSCEMVFKGTHPDLFMVYPTPPKSTKISESKQEAGHDSTKVASNWTVKVEQIKQVKEKLKLYPLMASHQVCIIDDAEKMTNTTANSLLKLLEEPRPNHIFILITSQFAGIIATIRSRSIKYHFSPLQAEQTKELVKQIVAEDELSVEEPVLDFLVRCFQGSVVNIVKALRSDFDWQQLFGLFRQKRDFVAINQLVQQWSRAQMDYSILLQVLKQVYLDDCKQGLQAELSFFDKIKQAELQLRRHIQKDFVFENLLLGL